MSVHSRANLSYERSDVFALAYCCPRVLISAPCSYQKFLIFMIFSLMLVTGPRLGISAPCSSC